MPTTTRCFPYVRISKDDLKQLRKERGGGKVTLEEKERKVANHRLLCERRADENWTVTEMFDRDWNISCSRYAKKPREDYARLLTTVAADNDISSGFVILTTEVERLYRDPKELQELIDLAEGLDQFNGIVTTDGESYNLHTPEGIHGIRGVVANAERESRKASQRQRRRTLRDAELGRYHGAKPFGYNLAPETLGRIVPNEDEKAIILDAAYRLLGPCERDGNRCCIRCIQLLWEDKGILGGRGTHWEHTEVRRLFQNKLYIGIKVHRPAGRAGRQPSRGPGREYAGAWEPILDETTFDAIGRLLANEDRTTTRGHEPVFLLAGKCFCDVCDARMKGIQHAGTRSKVSGYAKRPHYICPPAPYGHQCVGIKAEWVEKLAERAVVHLLREGGPFESALAASTKDGEAAERLAELRVEQSQLRSRLADFKRECADALMSGRGISQQTVYDIAGPIEERLSLLYRQEGKLTATAEQEGDADLVGMTADQWESLSFPARRSIIDRIFLRIEIARTHRGRLDFDPSRVKFVPGSWAADADPDLLAVPYPFSEPKPLMAETALKWVKAHHPDPVSPAMIARDCGRPHPDTFSRALKQLEARGDIVMIQQGAGRRPNLYVLAGARIEREAS